MFEPQVKGNEASINLVILSSRIEYLSRDNRHSKEDSLQNRPCQDDEQLQRKLSFETWQTPEFRHGVDKHGSESES